MTTTAPSVTGTDGVVPLYQPDARWTIWALADIYTGTTGQGKYIPNVNDYVIDYATDERYIVTDLDITTLIPVLKPIPTTQVATLSDIDVLLGVGPGTQSDTYRVYIDQSVIPHTLAVDARLKVNGSLVTTAKIFQGSELSSNEQVISAFYDQNGIMLGQSIPLETVQVPNGVNYAVKSVPVCYTTQDLVDGEIVTIVFYSTDGHVVSKRQLLVENTAFIPTSDSGVKYVTDITLESPFLSSADQTLLQYPINIPVAGLNLMGRVHYSDGSSVLMPVDGTKFAIYGLNNYVASIVGQTIPLVLRYNLSPGEVAYGASVASQKFLTANYKATTLTEDGAYSVKLFGFPVWIDAVNGYRLEWWLYNLDRQTVFHVTPYVKINDNTAGFNPTAYGIVQNLSVSVNLNDVSPTYASYIHTQTVTFTLIQAGNLTGTNWTVGFSPGQNPPFGFNNFASTTFVNQNLTTVNLGMNASTQSDWLNRIYALTQPLYDPQKETAAPTPDTFAIVTDNNTYEFPITDWNTTLSLSETITPFSTMFIRFYQRTVDNDLQLAIAGLPVYQTN